MYGLFFITVISITLFCHPSPLDDFINPPKYFSLFVNSMNLIWVVYRIMGESTLGWVGMEVGQIWEEFGEGENVIKISYLKNI